jgi:hypothetical protein
MLGRIASVARAKKLNVHQNKSHGIEEDVSVKKIVAELTTVREPLISAAAT